MLWAVEVDRMRRSSVRPGSLWESSTSSARRCAGPVLRNGFASHQENGRREREANAQINLGNAYQTLPTGDLGENLRKAIECCQAALRVLTERDFSVDWAGVQNNLGIVYANLPTGDRSENLREAIQYYEAALRVYTERDFPVSWAMTQNNLGIVYSDLPRKTAVRICIKRSSATRQLCGVHGADFPMDWAMIQNNLGTAYSTCWPKTAAKNLGKAIRCYEAALRVYTERDFPVEWARAQNNLGTAYSDLLTGDHGDLRRGIQCYEAALRVRTELDFPVQWAKTQKNLGLAYLNLPTGDRTENMRQALACFENAERGYRAVHMDNDASEVATLIASSKYGAK